MAPSRKNSAHCSVVGCNNNKTNKSLSFFALPTDDERRNQWLKIIGRTDLLENPNLKPRSFVVCSSHFETDLIILRPFLKPEAIPTKYIPNMPSDDDDTRSTQFEARAMDVSTQTKDSQVNVTSKVKNPFSGTVAVQANEENKDLNTQTPLGLSSNTSRKRTLPTRFNDSKKSKRKLENDKRKKRTGSQKLWTV